MRLFVLCALIVIGGCAANPGTPPASDAAAASSPAAQPAAAQPAAAQPAAAQPAAAQPATEVDKVLAHLPPGFKATRISGELFYCRKMVVLGSRFPKLLCLNEDQVKEYMAGNEA